MCVNKVYVKDRYRLGNVGQYYNCGRCPACRQASANRRARRIVHHKDVTKCAYFITLTFDPEHIPYFRLSHLRQINECLLKGSSSECLPIYFKNKAVDSFILTESLTECDLQSFRGVNVDKSYDPDKISIAYNPVVQKFFKRLRSRLQYDFPDKEVRLSYYYAPEYGPTSQRFHIHLLIWFPAFLSEVQVKDYVCKAWPFARRDLTASYVEIARSAARYVASYINCSADVSPALLKLFPLRPSHSLYFGFGEELFSLQNILDTYDYTGDFMYDTNRITSSGQFQSVSLRFPSYCFYRYFPKCKGFNRLSYPTLLRIYLFPKQYFRQSKKVDFYTDAGNPQYSSNIVDVYGVRLTFGEKESYYFANRLINTYERYWRNLIYSYTDFVYKCLDVLSSLASVTYKSQFDSISGTQLLQCFFNIDEFKEDLPPSLSNIASCLSYIEYDCNKFESEIGLTREYALQYLNNIKTRKINHLDGS